MKGDAQYDNLFYFRNLPGDRFCLGVLSLDPALPPGVPAAPADDFLFLRLFGCLEDSKEQNKQDYNLINSSFLLQ